MTSPAEMLMSSHVDYFLNIDHINGGSDDAMHYGEIELVSWSWGETNESTAASGVDARRNGGGKVVMRNVRFAMIVNTASPTLALACAEGRAFGKAVLTCRRAGGAQEDYLTLTFEGVRITSYETGGNPDGIIPHEQVAFAYSRVEYSYRPMNPDGTLGSPVMIGWDLASNKRV